MRRFAAVITVAVLLVSGTVAPARAITGNYEPDYVHPFVGLAVFYDADGEFLHRCSGSLLTPIVFLTAGHCVDEATSARVYFQQDAGVNYDPETELDPVTGYPEDCYTQPCTTGSQLFNFGFSDFSGLPNTQDLGIVILDEPISLDAYGVLPAVGTLDPLDTKRGRQNLVFTDSGYGLSESNPVHVESYRERLMATSRLVNLKSALTAGFNLQTTNNPGNGSGGTCSGDSGGPIFYPSDSFVIVAVTSFGLNEWCRGVDFAYRTDQQEAIDWIVGVADQFGEAGNLIFA
ncbi:MAG: trypsin-like serine protease [Thermomicrobiales bacterium]